MKKQQDPSEGEWIGKRPAVKRGQILLFANQLSTGEVIVGAAVVKETAKGRKSGTSTYWSVPFPNPFRRRPKKLPQPKP